MTEIRIPFRTVEYRDGKLVILDQTKLPEREEYMEICTREDLVDSIRKLKVRGAPAIGVAAAYGMCAVCRNEDTGEKHSAEWDSGREKAYLEELAEYISAARPTAVNLFRATERVLRAGTCAADRSASREDIIGAMEKEASGIHREDVEFCTAMGIHGLELLEPGMGILTHCNAGALATTGTGTCLAPVYLAQAKGYGLKVYVDETRPLLQGARLTAWELEKAGVDVSLQCDNMAAWLMQQGRIDAVITGCDRMTCEGDGANKIGTLGLAVLADHFGIPFYMFVPSSTIDMNTEKGEDIIIEMRDEDEVRKDFSGKCCSPEDIPCSNPAFDVTPHQLITAVVTEKGVVRPPYRENLEKLFAEK